MNKVHVPSSSSLSSVARDLICFSHLRWGFVYQRPQHLLSRAATAYRVHFFEEPVFEPRGFARLQVSTSPEGVNVVVPHLPEHLQGMEAIQAQRRLLNDYIRSACPRLQVAWYYTPMALTFSRHVHAPVTVYDCMDELSGFKSAPTEIGTLERELLSRADIVFTGGLSLYEAKKRLHGNVHAFPSSVDVAHFKPARSGSLPEPADLAPIPQPRIGFFGVIDERLDLALVDEVARLRPDWQIVMIGPVVKIDPDSLPERPNLHWLGGKTYAELPAYLSGLNVGFMPFALNEATRFISPTKTPEFLAAGLGVASTPVTDVVRTWGAANFVEIAASPPEMVESLDRLLHREDKAAWLSRVDRKLSTGSWNSTWAAMRAHLARVPAAGRSVAAARTVEQVSHV